MKVHLEELAKFKKEAKPTVWKAVRKHIVLTCPEEDKSNVKVRFKAILPEEVRNDLCIEMMEQMKLVPVTKASFIKVADIFNERVEDRLAEMA